MKDGARMAFIVVAALCAGAVHAHETGKSPASAENVTIPRGKPDLAGPDASAIEKRQRAYFTDTELLTQDGRKVRFYTDILKDRLVVLNFIYTNCSDACPLITAKLASARAQMNGLEDKGLRLVSISIDPVRDTPQALAAFAGKFDARRDDWVFLTGTKRNIDTILKKLGAYTEEVGSHNTAIIAGNLRNDHWRRIRPETPDNVIAETVRYLADPDNLR